GYNHALGMFGYVTPFTTGGRPEFITWAPSGSQGSNDLFNQFNDGVGNPTLPFQIFGLDVGEPPGSNSSHRWSIAAEGTPKPRRADVYVASSDRTMGKVFITSSQIGPYHPPGVSIGGFGGDGLGEGKRLSFPEGTMVTVEAVAYPGYRFVGWD